MDACKHGEEPGTVSFDEAVELSGIERRRFAGLIVRDLVRMGDPRGCKVCGRTYLDSIKKAADQPSGVADRASDGAADQPSESP